MIKERKRNGKTLYVLDYILTHPDGSKERLRKDIPEHAQTKTKANAWAQQYVSTYISQGKKEKTKLDRITLDDLFIKWIAKKELDRLSQNTIQHNKYDYKNTIGHCLGKMIVCDINVHHFDLVRKKMHDRKPQVVNNAIAMFHGLMTYAHAMGYHKGLTERVKRIKIGKQVPESYNPEEIDRILEACQDDSLYGLVLLGSDAGLRLAEACGLRWKNVDIKARRIIVCEQRSRAHGKIAAPKNKRDRIIPMSDRLYQYLSDRVRHLHHDYVLTNTQNNPLTQYVHIRLRKIYEIAGVFIPKQGTHIFRHSFATNLLRAGVDIRTVQDLMGHASIEQTAIYIPTNVTTAIDAVKRLG